LAAWPHVINIPSLVIANHILHLSSRLIPACVLLVPSERCSRACCAAPKPEQLEINKARQSIRMTILLTCDMRHGLDESAEVKVPVGGKVAPQTAGKVRSRFFTVKEGNDEMPSRGAQ